MFGRKKKPAWRIVKDPHAEQWTVERRQMIAGPLGGIAYWSAQLVVGSLSEAEAWLSREVNRPIVCGAFDASGRPVATR